MGIIVFFQNLGIIAAGIVALVAAWKGVVLPTYRGIKYAKRVIETLDKVAHEFSPNGGSSMRDAIDRIEARQIIAEQRQKLLVMDSPFAVFETDETGEFVDVNRTYCRWIGRSPMEMTGMGWVNTIAPAWRACVVKQWTLAVNQEREFSMNYRLLDTDDKTIPVHCTAFPLYNHKKKLSGWIGIVSQIPDKEVPKDAPEEC